MPDRLPPFKALRAFDAAARHPNLRMAAEELHVTPAAISQQIKSLEEMLGVMLFKRLPRGLELTEAGKAGLPKLREGLACLRDAVLRMQAENSRETLTVWMAPSFAAKWLVPRLHRFIVAYPEIDIRIAANAQLITSDGSRNRIDADSFQFNMIDVAITFSRGQHLGCQSVKLLSTHAVPLCSPHLLSGDRPLNHPQALRHHTLLHDDTDYGDRPGWANWLNQAGVKGIDAQRGPRFNHSALVLEAAADQQGVALTVDALATVDLATGRLVIPFGPKLPLSHSYYMVYPRDAEYPERIARFRDWLLQETVPADTPSSG
jgi:LysR family glycine cleavage system transcriptional activator